MAEHTQASIHAPARGATLFCGLLEHFEIASIHAPARGATRSRSPRPLCKLSFNPRSRTGSDAGYIMPAGRATMLQSTLPHGERLESLTTTAFSNVASIHAPARGATGITGGKFPTRGASIHAPARGATYGEELVDQMLDASIHAPARGATVALFYLCPAMIFRAFFEQATYLDQFMQ